MDVDIDIRREVKTVHNVGAYLPGDTDEYVILGAHYDHLGLGEQFSLAPSLAGTVHPGADDNASGTAGVIELAHWFSHEPKHKRGILFLTFAGEELGLLGSSYYVNHPILPLANAVAMINMDMIGRIRDRKIYVGGVGTGTTFAELAQRSRSSITTFRPTPPSEAATDRAIIRPSPPSRYRCCSSFRDCTPIITSPATPGTRSMRRMRCSCWT